MSGTRIPTATYRLQFHAGFRFSDALRIVPYLQQLGITAIYASPPLQARAGSLHGYDVTDHAKLNPELGDDADFAALSDALRERDMGLIMDVVPNHMEIDDASNHWWQDVLENGPSSVFAPYFDIDWLPPKTALSNRVLLPVLGDQFGKVLESGQISLRFEKGSFSVVYYERRFPIDPWTVTKILEQVAEHLRFTTDAGDADMTELQSILTSLRHLPKRTASEASAVQERRREKSVAKRRLTALCDRSPPVRRAIEGVIVEWNGQPGTPRSFDRLEALLDQQAYRLCHWKVATDEINYRRFFDINDLAAIRVENADVFQAVHNLLFRLISDGRITGLRIDHPDGLYDPEQYFRDLQRECGRRMPHAPSDGGQPEPNGSESSIYIVAEKILSHSEQLPVAWAVHGTTGYEILNLINGVFVNRAARDCLNSFYAQIRPHFDDFDELVYRCKKLILSVSMSSELYVLARRLDRISEQHRYTRDFTLSSLRQALVEVIASFPVYRTYAQEGSTELTEDERKHVDWAVRSAKRRNRAMEASVFDFVRSILMLEEPEGLDGEQRQERRGFVLRLQQLTGPVMAKGVEDTAFYRAYPLASLNEVGGEPQQFGISLDEFHRANKVRCARCPFAMTSTSTHDNKRSEDVRAWLNVLSEIPEEWVQYVQRWQEMNANAKTILDDQPAPDANEEYLLYQTLVGTWPLGPPSEPQHNEYVERIVQYMEKACREAKLHTSWINPNTEYVEAVSSFIRSILRRDPQTDNPFVNDLGQLRARIDIAGMTNALAQVLLKINLPGVPDFYQGTELWNFTLVDPDNRRVVDYQSREQIMNTLVQNEWDSDGIRGLLDNWRDGRIKAFVTQRALDFRRSHAKLFLEGEYEAVEVLGKRASNVIAFTRRRGGEQVLVIVPRLTAHAGVDSGNLPNEAFWEDTRLQLSGESATHWRNIFYNHGTTDESGAVSISHTLNLLPVALLSSD